MTYASNTTLLTSAKRTADLAIRHAREHGVIVQDGAQYRLPL